MFAESAADVARAVRFARAHTMRIAPQGTGHGAEPLEPLEGAVLLRTSRMRRVDINTAASTARAEAGALWRDVTVPAGEYGLAALAGTSPDVGVTGYTLGGGIGWLARRYGLAASSVAAAEIVTPDGSLARADAGHEPDLLWAVKGGGGSVGVVTALEMSLYPVRELYAGSLFFPIQRAAQVLHAWRAWTGTVPDEVTSLGRILRFPAVPEVPGPLRGRAFALVEAACLADAAAGAENQQQLILAGRGGQLVDQRRHQPLERSGCRRAQQRAHPLGNARPRPVQRRDRVPPKPRRVIVASVQRQPGHRPVTPPGPAGQQRRLAEPGRGAHQDQPPY